MKTELRYFRIWGAILPAALLLIFSLSGCASMPLHLYSGPKLAESQASLLQIPAGVRFTMIDGMKPKLFQYALAAVYAGGNNIWWGISDDRKVWLKPGRHEMKFSLFGANGKSGSRRKPSQKIVFSSKPGQTYRLTYSLLESEDGVKLRWEACIEELQPDGHWRELPNTSSVAPLNFDLWRVDCKPLQSAPRNYRLNFASGQGIAVFSTTFSGEIGVMPKFLAIAPIGIPNHTLYKIPTHILSPSENYDRSFWSPLWEVPCFSLETKTEFLTGTQAIFKFGQEIPKKNSVGRLHACPMQAGEYTLLGFADDIRGLLGYHPSYEFFSLFGYGGLKLFGLPPPRIYSAKFTVREGEVVYLGNLNIHYYENVTGFIRGSKCVDEVRDEWDRDSKLLQKRFPHVPSDDVTRQILSLKQGAL